MSDDSDPLILYTVDHNGRSLLSSRGWMDMGLKKAAKQIDDVFERLEEVVEKLSDAAEDIPIVGEIYNKEKDRFEPVVLFADAIAKITKLQIEDLQLELLEVQNDS